MEESLSGTLAIDLGNTNTVVAFQDHKDILFSPTLSLEVKDVLSMPF